MEFQYNANFQYIVIYVLCLHFNLVDSCIKKFSNLLPEILNKNIWKIWEFLDFFNDIHIL